MSDTLESLFAQMVAIDTLCIQHQQNLNNNEDIDFDYNKWRDVQQDLFAQHRALQRKVHALGGNWRDSRK